MASDWTIRQRLLAAALLAFALAGMAGGIRAMAHLFDAYAALQAATPTEAPADG